MSIHPDDRPDPLEQPLRARVPDKVAGGCFSTGVIVMTAATEFVLDFVQNLGRPHQIVARVVMPHNVLPQLVDALGRNIQLYRGRWGDLPNPKMHGLTQIVGPGFGGSPQFNPPNPNPQENQPHHPEQPAHDSDRFENQFPHSGSHSPGGQAMENSQATPDEDNPHPEEMEQVRPPQSQPPTTPGHGVRQATAQEIYDDLKIRDELLSGVYANAVMIGHGPHEFSFDFITNFYPNSAVSARVFLAAGQIPRLYDSLKGTWEQLRNRMGPPPPPPPSSDDLPPPGWVV